MGLSGEGRKIKHACICSHPLYIWGVDSASVVTRDFYRCVTNIFGKPIFWGRYLTGKQHLNDPLVEGEVRILHEQGTKVLLVDNSFSDAIGKSNGLQDASNAVSSAKKLKVPSGKYIFADIEPSFNVDADWIIAWVCKVLDGGYRPGIYCSADSQQFDSAYCKALENDCVSHHVTLWSYRPQHKTTNAKEAPAFNPTKPSCKANVWGWQYGQDTPVCPSNKFQLVDTSLFDARILNGLW